MKKLSLVLAVTLIMLITLIGAAFAEKVNNCAIANTVEVAADSGEISKDITVKPGDYIKVILYANGGTGYGWELNSDNIVEQISKNTMPVDDKCLAGGPERYEFVLLVRPEASEPRTLHFVLIRPWEKTKQPAQVFDLNLSFEQVEKSEQIESENHENNVQEN
jgi:predicted secreted protein